MASDVPKVEVDLEALNPLTPEVIARQATINIGMSRVHRVHVAARPLF